MKVDWKGIFLAILSGSLLFLSFPKCDLWYLAWIAFIPLLFSIQGKTLHESFRLGVLAGITFNIGIIYWVIFVTVHYGHFPIYLAGAVMIVFACYLGLYCGVFTLLISYLEKRQLPYVLTAPFLWTVLEYGKSNLLSGFPWENMGYSQHGVTLLIQIADVTGVYGLSFLIIFINCLIYDIATLKFKRRVFIEAAGGIILIGLVLSYGSYRMSSIEKAFEEANDIVHVFLIQGNIDQAVKWNPEYQKKSIAIYRELSLEATIGNTVPQLIVWPETAAPLFFQEYSDLHRDIISIAKEAKAYLLFGAPSYRLEKEGRSLMNSAYLVSRKGEITGKYDKTHLVPFGEYVPLRGLLFFIDKMVEGVGDFTAGSELDPLEFGGIAAGVLICYEGIFPEISREYKKRGVDLLVNMTNDAWYGETSAPYQHMSMVIFRAIENRTYLVRAANTGISAIVNPLGKVVIKSKLFTREVIRGNIGIASVDTIYMRHGDVFAKTCIVISIIMLGILLRRRRQ